MQKKLSPFLNGSQRFVIRLKLFGTQGLISCFSGNQQKAFNNPDSLIKNNLIKF